MNEQKKPGSGEHPAVKTYRQKLESLEDATIPALEELNERLQREVESTKPPPKHEEDPCDDP